jgi:hypothetical protein
MESAPESRASSSTPDREANPPLRIGWIVGLTLFALLFSGSAIRIVPGGPFISITGDLLPAVASVVAMRLGLLILRGNALLPKLLALLFILLATLALSRVMIDVYTFWIRPFARGDLIGF